MFDTEPRVLLLLPLCPHRQIRLLPGSPSRRSHSGSNRQYPLGVPVPSPAVSYTGPRPTSGECGKGEVAGESLD